MLQLKKAMQAKGMSGKELCKKVGITETSLSRIVKGNQTPRIELLIEIARELDVDIRDLFISTKSSPGRETIYVKRGGEYIAIGEVDFGKNQD